MAVSEDNSAKNYSLVLVEFKPKTDVKQVNGQMVLLYDVQRTDNSQIEVSD